MEELFKDIYTFQDLNNKIDDMEDNDNYDKWKDIASEYENLCVDYLRRLMETTTIDINYELGVEEDYVKSAISKIIGNEEEDK